MILPDKFGWLLVVLKLSFGQFYLLKISFQFLFYHSIPNQSFCKPSAHWDYIENQSCGSHLVALLNHMRSCCATCANLESHEGLTMLLLIHLVSTFQQTFFLNSIEPLLRISFVFMSHRSWIFVQMCFTLLRFAQPPVFSQVLCLSSSNALVWS